MTVQVIGPIGFPIDLRDHTKYAVTREGYSLAPHTTRILSDIAGGSVELARDEDNYLDLTLHLVILGAVYTTRKANRDAVIAVLDAASLYSKTQGREGTAAFYQEQWGDEPTPDVFPIVTGRLLEKGREGFAAFIDTDLHLVLRKKL
jgi:hypothetical protein